MPTASELLRPLDSPHSPHTLLSCSEPESLWLALHPTHIDVTGIGAPGQLLPAQIKCGERSVVPSMPQISPPPVQHPFLTRWYRSSVDVAGSSSTWYRLSLQEGHAP